MHMFGKEIALSKHSKFEQVDRKHLAFSQVLSEGL